MQNKYEKELSPEVREKMKKNLVYIGIFSVIMVFAGLTSAYIVSMGDSFWVKYDFPPAFYISTVIILLSSLVLHVGITLARKGNKNILKTALPLTLILGLGFAYFQWKGYGELVDKGAFLSSKITVSNGRYGNYYQLKINGQFMEVDGNEYLVAGKQINPSLKNEVSAFAEQFCSITKSKKINIKNYGKFTLMYKNQDVNLKNNILQLNDTTPLTFVDLTRLEEFSWHIRDGRGDFYHKGTFGKDFKVYYKGKELEYKERNLYYNGTRLNAPLQLKMDDAPDTASSYLYLITALHLLHIIGTLFYMLKMTIRSFSGDLSQYNYISLRTGAIFWHFLGLLWGYLLLFLLFIH